ncbi:hydrogenobyrinic acid a,c-diamide synthase (glutamine-hydrolysing) /cobyrinate a,c-diamide synthase [Arboricoccus pini]|uniref:Cobyrinate a,c-diamide synthase n=1 Tax=Arboricoccus pini TaxID=1963835 RepID=A0A212QRJ1_9PROT|nr:cobyrinate a,c-diamide synthase [Arboricoccus pini]SNB62211.1 hydrogenobyrinic acid a,c-diamide synthase (glutamine-hydrolysing) /cobyrinate a,c-diamide synthase [Arboricoccus pini]
MSAAGFILSAPATGSGKTVLAMGLMRAFRRRGLDVGSFKVGPDYIDPAFHRLASGHASRNLDAWSMRLETLASLSSTIFSTHELVIGEGVMGLFDAAADGTGSTGDLAALLDLPVILVIDVGSMGASIAALASGFIRHRQDVEVAGLILNRVASARHAAMLTEACGDHLETPVLGWIGREADLALPSRHLGLIQAREQTRIEQVIERAAEIVAERLDLDRLLSLARPSALDALHLGTCPLPPLGQHIAVAEDVAFAFHYQTTLEGWRQAGAEVSFFSPLADEPPASHADAIFLPGGYPELHAGRLASASRFKAGLAARAAEGAAILGECGGFMVLGQGLIDADGRRHEMAGLLPTETSFAARQLHLGYRRIRLCGPSCLGPAGTRLRGHEFHYATLCRNDAAPLLQMTDARGDHARFEGALQGRIAGTFAHIVDRAS